MIPITLSNHENIEVENESAKTSLVIRTDNFADIDAWKEKLTEENVNGALMEGEILSDLIYTGFDVQLEGAVIKTTFMFREKTKDEALNDRLNELEDAVNFLIMGGE